MKHTWQMWVTGISMSLAVAVNALAASASLDEWGALASISTAQCASDFCGDATDAFGFFGSLAVAPVDGGAGATTASVSSGTYPAPGGAVAEATVSGGLAVPLLRAAAAGDGQVWIGGQALVAQGYSYTGSGPQTLSLDWVLEGDIVNPDADPTTGFVVFVGFFDVGSLSFPDLGDPLAAYTLLGSLALASPDDNFREFTATGAVLAGDTLSIDVDTGAQFYLVMGLMAGAGGAGASAQSLSNLTAQFQGLPPLTPVIATVPLPASAWLLLGGLGSLLGLARRRA